jgi:hypothetical protein
MSALAPLVGAERTFAATLDALIKHHDIPRGGFSVQ